MHNILIERFSDHLLVFGIFHARFLVGENVTSSPSVLIYKCNITVRQYKIVINSILNVTNFLTSNKHFNANLFT